jgi:hypothetical protein
MRLVRERGVYVRVGEVVSSQPLTEPPLQLPSALP